MHSEYDLDLTNLSSEESELCLLLLQQEGMASNQPSAIPRRSSADQAALSFAQQRLWYLEQLLPGSTLYNIPFSIRLKGNLQVDALRQSLRTIIQRHEILRTTFVDRGGKPWQVIGSAPPFPLATMDLRSVPLEERQQRAQELAEQEATHIFDLSQGPLLRALLLRLEDEEWLLLLTFHHIIFDGWSIGVFFQEVATCYQAWLSGDEPALAPLPIAYADYAIWQREQEKQGAYADHRAYWQKQIQNAPTLLELPTDYTRPAISNFAGDWEPVRVSRDLTDRLQALARQEGCSLFMVLLAAWFTLLYRYSGQEDLVIGAPIANRTRLETEQLIGLFVNTLALRVFLGDNPSFRELLERVRKVTLEAYTHQELPFEQVVKLVQHSRELSYMPLVQALFVLQNTPDQRLHLPGVELEWTMRRTPTAKFDLTLDLTETAEGLSGALEYSTELFSQSRMRRLLGHLDTLLEAVVSDPERHLSALPILTEAEQRQLLIVWNDARIDYPRDTCIHQLFEAQVERDPGAVALIFEDRRLTYRELNRRANQLAHYLQALGVGPETLVGICMERSVEMVVGLLAVLKAGGAYLPLDPAYPRERVAFMLQDSQAALLLTQQRLLKDMPEQGARVVCLDSDWETIAQESQSNPYSAVTASNLAYVIYTSGSTGRPKGVAIEHHSTVTLLYWAKQVFSPEELSGVLASTSICFDLSIFEMFVPLSWGGKVILTENILDLPLLRSRDEVTLLNTVPSAIAALLRINGVPASVVTVNLAGEALQSTLVQRLYRLNTIQRVFNLYGPTEDTTYSTFIQVKRDFTGAPPIGRPIANTQVYVLDALSRPVPVGVPGELYLGGEGLARGYLNRPELTSERFVSNPFSRDSRARLYRTGDRVCYLADGQLEFLGRLDHQVKIRGFRIELGEIEAALSQHPAIKEVVVVMLEDVPGDKRLVAYLVLDLAVRQNGLFIEALRDFLKATLPHYMIPAVFVSLDALPLTPNGKVNRKALPAPDYKPASYGIELLDAPAYLRPALSTAYVPPRNEVERTIAEQWEEYLGIAQIGIHDRFEELGGDSLLVLQIISRLHTTFGIRLSVRDFLASPTIAETALMIKQRLAQLIDQEALEVLLAEVENQR